MRWKPDSDVGDEVGPSRSALLDEVEHVASVEHREVGAFTNPVDELGEQRMAEPAQRLLPCEAAGELERGDTEPVAARFGQVDDEPALLKHSEQVIDR